MRLMMAGYEAMNCQASYDLLAQHGLGVLVSYYSLRNKRVFEYPPAGCSVPLVIDSGAYTLQQPDKICSHAQLRTYVRKYIAYLDEHEGEFLWAADLDVEFSFGLKVMQECLDQLTSSGHPICPVWHPERGVSAWRELCDQYQFVGLATQDVKRRKQLSMDQFRTLAYYAYKQGCKLHVMAMTDMGLLLEIPCYTADSTSWLGYQRWANHWETDTTRSRTTLKLDKETRPANPVVDALIRVGLRTKTTYLAQGRSIMPYTLEAIGELQRHVTTTWSKRGVIYDAA